jgi:hypothetical protein
MLHIFCNDFLSFFMCFANVLDVCCKYFICFTHMLQVFYLDIIKVDLMLHMLLWDPPSRLLQLLGHRRSCAWEAEGARETQRGGV